MRRRRPTHAGQGPTPGHGWAPRSLISSARPHLSQIQDVQHCRAPTGAPVPHSLRASRHCFHPVAQATRADNHRRHPPKLSLVEGWSSANCEIHPPSFASIKHQPPGKWIGQCR